MTKRRREILTAIESINEWFETSDPITHAAESAEGSTGWSLTTDPLPDLVTTNGWEVVESGPDPSTELRVEAFQVVPVVAKWLLTWAWQLMWRPAHHYKLLTIPNWQLCRVAVQPPKAAQRGRIPGNEEGNNSEIIGQSIELERERERVINAFWRLLSDVGYDTW